jgi:plastocyanin
VVEAETPPVQVASNPRPDQGGRESPADEEDEMDARRIRILAACIVGFALAATVSSTVVADDMGTRITDAGLETPEITLHPVGAAVHWTVEGTLEHSLVFADGVTSPVISPGQSWSRTFDAIGDHPYSCSLHPREVGVIHVIEAEPAPSASGGGDSGNAATPPPTTTSPAEPGDTGSGVPAALAILLVAALLGQATMRRSVAS